MIIRHRTWRRAACLGTRTATVLCLVALALSVYVTVSPLPGAGAATGGAATVVTPNGNSPVTGGDGGTDFTLLLPTGSACSGDTAGGGYRVHSYMVPSTLAPGDLKFETAGIVGKSNLGAVAHQAFRQPLYETTASPYENKSTAMADAEGGPGPVLPPPAFDFVGTFGPGQVPAGVYNVGMACVRLANGEAPLDKYWNTRVEVKVAASAPAGITWTVLEPAAATATALTVAPPTQAAGGGNVILTATVSPSVAGKVEFFDDGSSLGAAVNVTAGSAKLTTTTLAPGERSLSATFTPTDLAKHLPSTSSLLTYTISGASGASASGSTASGASGANDTAAQTASTATTSASASFSGVGTSTGAPFATLPATGGSVSMTVWGFLALVFGRMAVLLARPPRILPVTALA